MAPTNVLNDVNAKPGIDVSANNLYKNGPINWILAKQDGVEFAIIKVIRKDLSPDKQFENNWWGCINAGIPIQGVYNYTYATTVSKAISDARAVLKILGADRHPFIWLDYEWQGLPKTKLAADIINAYDDVITAGGCQFGIYFGMSYYNSYLDAIIPFVKPEYRKGWEARYYAGYNQMSLHAPVNTNKRPNNFDGVLYGWQYSSSGRVAGIDGNVDLDLWYVAIEADSCTSATENYKLEDFILNSRKVWDVDMAAGAQEIVNKTVTVSTTQNKSHDIVTELERYMKALGYYNGKIEADQGKTPLFGNGMKKAIILYQTDVVKAIKKYRDGVLTARGATWRQLYGYKR